MSSEFPALPRHIAIIMDGNGRWARRHTFSRVRGHRIGVETVRRIVTECRELGIQALTLYAFSEENWNRPASEIAVLMRILRTFLVSERDLMMSNQIRLRAIGDLSRLPNNVREILEETMEQTRQNRGMTLVLALSYGGRDEITRAVRNIARRVHDGSLDPEAITPETIGSSLDTAGIPDPDLLIRTSGEQRVSNFLPWQAIYSEFYVTPTLWPDFSVAELHRAIRDYASRERRFGRTGEQLRSLSPQEERPCRSAK